MRRLGARRTAQALALTALCWSGAAVGTSAAAWAAEAPQTRLQADAQADPKAEKAPASRGGSVLKAGWWWKANNPPADTGVVAFPQAPTPNTPAGHLPVAANVGDADKIVAVELVLDAKPGATVKSATVVLTESTASGANYNTANAKIQACPVTDGFWADGTAARWDAQPAFNCEAGAVDGVRDEDGRWTFDLTTLAAAWLADGFSGSSSFALVEAVDAPQSFQVTFAPIAEDGILFTGAYTGGTTTTTPPPTSGGGSGGSAGGGGSVGGGLGSGSAGGSSGGDLSSGSLDSGSTGGGDLSAAPADGDMGTVEATDLPVTATTPVAARGIVPPWYGGLPKATFLLVPFALGLAYLAMLALGPDAQPTATTSRRGVSRALDRLRTAGTQTLAGARR